MSRKEAPLQIEFPLERAFTFAESGPVLLVSTCHGGKSNLMTVSCHASMGFEPSIGICLGPWNFSHAALEETGECVIAIPPASLMTQVVDIGNCSGEAMDKFRAFGLTPQPSSEVAAPLVAECLYNLECRVINRALAASHHFYVLRGVKAWRHRAPADTRTFHAVGDGTFIVDGETIDLRRRMVKWQDCI